MNVHAKFLAVEEITELVQPVLADDLREYDVQNVFVAEEEAFDGDPMIRMIANVGEGVPPDVFAKVLNAVSAKRRTANEERLVLMSTSKNSDPNAAQPREDID